MKRPVRHLLSPDGKPFCGAITEVITDDLDKADCPLCLRAAVRREQLQDVKLREPGK